MFVPGVPLRRTKLIETGRLTVLSGGGGTNLEDTVFYVRDKRHLECISVGIICFSVEPKTQNIFLLLGKETCFKNLKSSRGVWCDLGGKPHALELPHETAAREFVEESMGCVQMFPTSMQSEDMQTEVTKLLKNKQYAKKIQVVSKTYWKQNEMRRQDFIRMYYLKEIPWQPHIPQTFQVMRKHLLHIKNTGKTSGCPFSMRRHPALTLTFPCPSVSNNYLEKCALNWWSLDRLNEVLQKKGRYKSQLFRKSFLPVLKIVVHILKRFYV
jgi:hypothetical protein